MYGGAPVNNAGIDPMQGFDFECWAQDSHNGSVAFFGRFQSLTLSVRDATETYLELGQRIPIYLNGEIQIAWVLEQGLVDMAFVTRTFGVNNIRRDQLITRGPRFHIAFDANAAERRGTTAENRSSEAEGANEKASGLFNGSLAQRLGGRNARSGFGDIFTDAKGRSASSEGRYELMRCKVDSVSLGIMPGRRVAAVRWEGVSEGISYIGTSVQTFKDAVTAGTTNGTSSTGGSNAGNNATETSNQGSTADTGD